MDIPELGCTLDNHFGAIAAKAMEDVSRTRVLPIFSTLLILSLPTGLILFRSRVRFLKYWSVALALFLVTVAGNRLFF